MVLSIVATACASSLATLALAALVFQRWIRPRLDRRLVDIQQQFEVHVKAGVLAAGRELLPALREQVRLGFEDALKGSHAVNLAEGTAKIVSGSADLLVDRLGNLFGLVPRK